MLTFLLPQDFQGLVINEILTIATMNVAIARLYSCMFVSPLFVESIQLCD